jgi:hypothetical protein
MKGGRPAAVGLKALLEGRDWTPEELEDIAGKLLVRAATDRIRRGGPDDDHQTKHIYAAITVGNTDDEQDDDCKLDAIDDMLFLSGWPQVDAPPRAG